MKKILFLKLLALVACLSSALSATAYDFKYGSFYYNILTNTSSSRTVEVTNSNGANGTAADYPNSSYSVPTSVPYNGNTYTVTAIGDYAFANYESGYPVSEFTSITLPNTITSIGEGAFQRTGISSISLPSSLTTIGEYAFYHIYPLTSITIPYSVTSIGHGAFSQCWSLKTVQLSSALTSIPAYCFYDCALTSITIPSSVTTIGESAFRENTSLTTANIGNNVTDIGNYAFYNCNSLATLKLGFHVMRIGAYAFGHNDGNHHPIHVYCYCVAPPTLDINAFDRWDNQGGYDGWVYTLARKVNTFKADSGWSRFGTSNFSSHSGNECYDFYYDRFYYYIDGESNLFEPLAYVTYKDTNYNTYSGSLTIPNNTWMNGYSINVCGIGENAFRNSTDLTSLSFSSATHFYSVGENAFRNCTGLTTFNASSAPNLSSIGGYAFYGCTNLRTVKLASDVETIKNYAFYNCPLRWFTVDCSTPPTVYANTFTGDYNNCVVYVPTPADILTYQATDYWKKFLHYSSSRSWDFYYNGLYYAITSSNTVKVVRSNMYEYGPGTNYSGSITIPSTVPYNGTTYSVTAIGDFAFSQLVQDNKLTANGEPMIGDTSSPLTSVTIGSSVKTIGTGAFEYAEALTTITIPNSVTTIGSEAFRYCTGLKNVTIGTGVTSIGADAFKGCTALETVRSNRTTPPTIQSSTFDTNHYTSTKVYVPSSAINTYKSKAYWQNFYLILPNNGTELAYVLNASGTAVSLTYSSTGTYPWTVKGDGTRMYAQSGNAGVASSSSTLTASVNLSKSHVVTFDFKAWGEGVSYDKCIFLIDGVEQFSYGARDNDWETYSANIPAGSHTLTWTYSKDSSVNPTGDYFAVDNVKLTEITTQTGDVNGDGSTTIADVTALVDLLLGNGTAPAAADVNGDGQVTIADVTALVDMLLGS